MLVIRAWLVVLVGSSLTASLGWNQVGFNPVEKLVKLRLSR